MVKIELLQVATRRCSGQMARDSGAQCSGQSGCRRGGRIVPGIATGGAGTHGLTQHSYSPSATYSHTATLLSNVRRNCCYRHKGVIHIYSEDAPMQESEQKLLQNQILSLRVLSPKAEWSWGSDRGTRLP